MAKLETSMPGSSTWGFSRPLLPSSSLLGSSRLSSGDCRLGSDYFERGQASWRYAIIAEANLASCGVIIYNTHFAVANACNALSNGWSKKSRCERYTAGSVIRRDRLTRLAPSHLHTVKVAR